MAFLARLFSGKPKAETGSVTADPPSAIANGRDPLTEVETDILSGHFAAALLAGRQTSESRPDDTRASLAVMRALLAWGRVKEAGMSVERVRLSAHDKQSCALVGTVYKDLGQFDEAEKWLLRAMERDDDTDLSCRRALALVLIAQRRFVEATHVCEQALAEAPEDVELLNMLGAAHFGNSNFATASRAFRLAVQANPKSNEAWANLGLALRSNGNHAEGLDALFEAERLGWTADPHSAPDSFSNLATALKDEGRNEDALAVYERNLPLRPNVSAQCDYALNLLRVGRFAEGWKQYEFRWLQSAQTIPRPNISWPPWNGQSLVGRTILLRAEQGFGDTLQFIRFAPLVKALGARVLLRVQTELETLLEKATGVDDLVPTRETVPPVDFYVHLMSIPRILGVNDAGDFGKEPYVKPDQQRIARWADRLADTTKLKVGLTWAGNPSHLRDFERSTSLRALLPLLQVPGVQFISLQKGLAAKEIDRLPKEIALLDIAGELHDFAETAAALTQLDLLISVDTSVVHLAGAMGLPTWLLSRAPPDWRWRDGRSDSDWYPSLVHFEQYERGNWAGLIDRVAVAFRQWVQERTMGSGSLTIPVSTARPSTVTTSSGLEASTKRDDSLLSGVVEGRGGIFQYFAHPSPVGVSLERYGEWLQPQLDILGRILHAGATVIEAGAGIGAHSVGLSRIVGNDGHLILYESELLMRRVLRQNVEFNRLCNVTVMRRSLGKSEAGSISKPPSSESVDDLALERLDCVKINASVDAVTLLAHAGNTLWNKRPLLFIQARDHSAAREIVEFVTGYAYRCWQMDTPLFNVDNFFLRTDNVFGSESATALLAIPEERDVAPIPSGLKELS